MDAVAYMDIALRIVRKLGPAATMILEEKAKNMVRDDKSLRQFMISLKTNYVTISREMKDKTDRWNQTREYHKVDSRKRIFGENNRYTNVYGNAERVNARFGKITKTESTGNSKKYSFGDYNIRERQIYFSNITDDCNICISKKGYKPSKFTKHSPKVCRHNPSQYKPEDKIERRVMVKKSSK